VATAVGVGIAIHGCAGLLSVGDVGYGDAGPNSSEAAPGDAGTDLTKDATWCATRSPAPLFCSDFDTEPFVGGWNAPELTGGGNVGADLVNYISPPASLLTTALADPSGDYVRGRVCRSFPRFPSEAHLSFDVQVEQQGDASGAILASIRLNGDGHGGVLYFDINVATGGWSVVQTWLAEDGGQSASAPPAVLANTPAAGAWARLTLDVFLAADGGASSGSVRVSLDDQGVAETVLLSAPVSLQAVVGICVGIVDAHSDGWRLHHDNVTFDMLPKP
jgi:hypothetical protein